MNVLEKILEEIDNMEMIHVNYRRDTFRDGFSSGAKKCCEIIRSHMDEVKNDGWIPVEEGLPEANEIVMVTVHSSEWVSDFDTSFVPEEEKKFHPERYDVFVGCLRENREWIFFDESMSETSCEKEFGNDKGYIYSVVSAWCPFPEPYKPDEN